MPLAAVPLMRIQGIVRSGARQLLVIVAVFAPIVSGRAARADSSANDREVAGSRFGAEILLADVLSLGLVIGGATLGSKTDSAAVGYSVGIPGAVGYLVAGPIIHAAHHDGRGTLTSAAWRVLAPLAGSAIGYGIGYNADSDRRAGHDCSEGCAALGLSVVGFGVGVLTAMMADWTTAREPPHRRERVGTLVVPTVSIGPRATGVGLMMQF